MHLIKKAPFEYDGTLTEFYENWVESILLDPSVVEEFHRQFCGYYLESADPLFLVRQVTDQERGLIQRIDNNAQLRPTDNAPAWWIHYQLFSGLFQQYASFEEFIRSVPCHMFNIREHENISTAGWHIAHIFDVKNRDVAFHQWDRNELVRRTARNIHPCNYFYIAKCEWQRYGGDPQVIAFFYDKFKARYRTIWEEFLRLVDGRPPLGEYLYSFHFDEKDHPLKAKGHPPVSGVREKPDTDFLGCVAVYSFSRLCFKADVIEPLEMDDRFCIISKVGTFAMTKREFYETFPNVVKSNSYMQGRIYNYMKVPGKALKFRVDR